MKFLMEIKEIKQTKTASLDMEYTIKLVTEDLNLMRLSEIKPDQVVEVEINGVPKK